MANQRIPVIYSAAGGVVLHPTRDEILLLIRPSRDEVRLPKGHIDPAEDALSAAFRETAEEAGYDDLELVADLGEQLVAFTLGRRQIQRTEHYFLMRLRSLRECERPALDAEQFFAIWVSWDEALEHLTFEAEREWVRRARKVWHQEGR